MPLRFGPERFRAGVFASWLAYFGFWCFVYLIYGLGELVLAVMMIRLLK